MKKEELLKERYAQELAEEKARIELIQSQFDELKQREMK